LVLGFKDKKGNFRPTGNDGRGGIYQQGERSEKFKVRPIPEKSTYGKDALRIPGINNFMDKRREEQAYNKANKEQIQKIKEKEKNETEKLLIEETEKSKKKKEIRKLLEKGRIDSTEAKKRFGKLGDNAETVQKGKLPQDRIELTESSKKLLKSWQKLQGKQELELENLNALGSKIVDENGNVIGGQGAEKITDENRNKNSTKLIEEIKELKEKIKKSEAEMNDAKSSSGGFITDDDSVEKYYDSLLLSLEDKIKKVNDSGKSDIANEKKELEGKIKNTKIKILEITGKDPDSKFYQSPLATTTDNMFGSLERRSESDKGAFHAGKTIRDREEKEARQALQYGDKIPTFTTIPYQKKRKDPYTGEFVSQMADTKIDKQLASIIANAETQGYLDSGKSMSAEDFNTLSESDLKKYAEKYYETPDDPTQNKTPKGMGALIGLRASMAGRQ
jgi:hypothetical protein